MINLLLDYYTRLMQWWCKHAEVAHEWEWSVTDPYWKERDVWSCMRCHAELGHDPSVRHERKKTYRPVMPDGTWEVLQRLKTDPELADVRLRMVGRLAITD